MNKKFGLGKGIDALLEDYKLSSDSSSININLILESPYQPRKIVSIDSLQELIQSIQENGLIEPLVVRKINNQYELIAGHRRLKALKTLNYELVPVYIISATDKQAAQFSLIENIQRKDLNPIEIANSLSKIIQEFELTHESLANTIGKSRVYITNLLRLLNLDPDSQSCIIEEKISESHGRLLLQISDIEQRKNLLKDIIQKNLSVRDVENRFKKLQKKTKVVNNFPIYNQLKSYEKNFSHFFNRPVQIKKNKIEIVFIDESDVIKFIQHFKHLYNEE